MIEPPSFRSGRAFCTVKSVPLTLMLKSLSKCSSVMAFQRSKFGNPGVGENNIDPPLRPDGPVETIKVSQSGNISLNSSHVAADCPHGVIKFLLATARDEDIRALFDKQLGRSQPDPRRAASDDDYFSFELAHGHFPR